MGQDGGAPARCGDQARIIAAKIDARSSGREAVAVPVIDGDVGQDETVRVEQHAFRANRAKAAGEKAIAGAVGAKDAPLGGGDAIEDVLDRDGSRPIPLAHGGAAVQDREAAPDVPDLLGALQKLDEQVVQDASRQEPRLDASLGRPLQRLPPPPGGRVREEIRVHGRHRGGAAELEGLGLVDAREPLGNPARRAARELREARLDLAHGAGVRSAQLEAQPDPGLLSQEEEAAEVAALLEATDERDHRFEEAMHRLRPGCARLGQRHVHLHPARTTRGGGARRAQ